MSDKNSKINSWIENHLLPQLRKDFGKNKDAKIKYAVVIPEAFFMSEVYFLSVTFLDENLKLDLFVKAPHPNRKIRRLVLQDRLFRNEIHFYRNYVSYSFNLPRCYYMGDSTVNDSVIVMENIAAVGYDVCPKKINIEMEYTLAAMKEIGKYHANGYIFKEKSPNKFFDFCKTIEETRFVPSAGNDFQTIVNTSGIRPLLNLRKRNYDRKFCKKIEGIFENVFEKVLVKCCVPTEPLATVCHGDFTMNNIFFKRHASTGTLMAKLIDFAMLSYASPAIDVSTFLYLSCSREDLQEHFDEIFHVYYESVRECLVEAGIFDFDKFSYDVFLEDYKKHALFGYVMSVFFFPVMADAIPFGSFPEDFNPKVIGELHLNAGGDSLSNYLGDLLIDVIKCGLLDNFVD